MSRLAIAARARGWVPAAVAGVIGLMVFGASAQTPTKPPTEKEIAARKAMGGYFPERMKNPNLTANPPHIVAVKIRCELR